MNKLSKKISAIIIIGLVLFLMVAIFVEFPKQNEPEVSMDYSWTKHRYIAHAMGRIDEYDYTNSLEAFYENYRKGHRVFEVDFAITSDDKLVALHYWENAPEILGVADTSPLSREEFMQKRIYGKYTPLSCEDVFSLMQQYPDIYIVTDTKDTKDPEISKSFHYLYQTAKSIDINLLDRLIPQIYNEPMYEIIQKVYDWKSMIYTLYTLGTTVSDDEIITFAKNKGILVITTGQYRSNEEFFKKTAENQQMVYMHTYNAQEEIQPWIQAGAYGFYTDDLTPK